MFSCAYILINHLLFQQNLLYDVVSVAQMNSQKSFLEFFIKF